MADAVVSNAGKEDETGKKKNDPNNISKLWAGVLLISFIIIPIVAIIAYWPDKLPGPKDKIAPLYRCEFFKVRLACIPDDTCIAECMYNGTCLPDTNKIKTIIIRERVDSAISAKDSAIKRDTIIQNNIAGTPKYAGGSTGYLIHINTLLLILVALGGFLGNMIHISTSFVTFVGDNKFERSWLLWYFVKPFTAAALAIGLYFVFRGGFLNMNDGAASINLYGLMTISILTGLYTDMATLKMKEVFEVMFKSNDTRSGKREPVKIISITPMEIEKGKVNNLVITGEKLSDAKLELFINDEPVPIAGITATTITLAYTIPPSQENKPEIILVIKEAGNEVKRFVLKVK